MSNRQVPVHMRCDISEIDVIVVGGGAAGMMAAGQAASLDKRVLLLERNADLGKKLRITGKGRCNITNDADLEQFMQNVSTNGKFLYSAISAHSPRDTMDFFESIGVPLKVERGRRVFPQSDRAADVIEALRKWLDDRGVTVLHECVKGLETKGGQAIGVHCGNEIIGCQAIILATGGLSYPKTGSTGDGYRFAEALGHTIVPPHGSLVPLCADECDVMQGLSLRNVTLTLRDGGGAVLFKDMGELLFTHFGMSGPLVLSASAYLKDFSTPPYIVSINMKPALTPEEFDARLLRDITQSPNKTARNILAQMMHAACVPVVLQRVGVNGDLPAHSVTKEHRREIVRTVQGFCFTVAGTRPIDEAVITAGGVAVRDVNPKTMESKLVKGLYFAGELLDVDAFTGGYNLQIAWSTGYVAGRAAGCMD